MLGCVVSLEICPNQIFLPVLKYLYQVPMKLIALVCLLSLGWGKSVLVRILVEKRV